MEKIRMAILTKSSKNGAYCVAGIDLSNGRWVRLVTDDEASEGAVKDSDLCCSDGRTANVLDIIDVSIKGADSNFLQPENLRLETDTYIEIVGSTTLAEVLKVHPLEQKFNILGNDYNYITAARVHMVGYSLTIVGVTNLKIFHGENDRGNVTTKADFVYQGTEYKNMSVTDRNCYNIPHGTSFDNAVLVVSIGAPYNGRHYKFVSAIYV